jgi:serine carboxypeptidase-like clade 2
MCNDEIARNYVGTPEGSYGIYKELIKAQKYKIVPYSIIQFVYSGDLSSNVPLVGTKTWISRIKEDIDIPVRRTWREWWVPGKHPHEDQVGGMVWELEGMTYATVKAAGYMVGKDQPQALFEIYDAFLSDKRLPLTSTVSHKSKQ